MWSLSVEKYQSDFAKASEIYQLGLNTITSVEKQQELLQRYKQFAERMVQRMSRDVHNYLPPETNQKRIPAEVFRPTKEVQSEKIRLV